MNTLRRWASIAAVIAVACGPAILAQAPGTPSTPSTNEHWVGTWATAVVMQAPATPPGPPVPTPAAAPASPGTPASPAAQGGGPPAQPVLNFNNQTLRQIVHTSIGGDRIRIVLSNAFGTAPLTIGGAQVALRSTESAIVPASNRALTFSGQPSIAIAPGAITLSDPVALTVPAQSDLAISLFIPGDTAAQASPLTMHAGAFQTNYVSPTGNHAAAENMPVATTTQAWFLLARVEVVASRETGAIVAFGDSITDGTRSTPNTNRRWPDRLAARLLEQGGGQKFGVLNLGIAGNRVLTDAQPRVGINAQARMDRDVLTQPGATHVVFLESINDIGQARQNPSPSAADLIAGHKQFIARAHARGLKIYGGTLTPFEGAAYYTLEGEAKRQAVNQWIRTSKAYDAVIDFDAVVRDPQQPTRILPLFDSGDHLHPGDAGLTAMGNAVDLALFKTAVLTSSR